RSAELARPVVPGRLGAVAARPAVAAVVDRAGFVAVVVRAVLDFSAWHPPANPAAGRRGGAGLFGAERGRDRFRPVVPGRSSAPAQPLARTAFAGHGKRRRAAGRGLANLAVGGHGARAFPANGARA